MALDKYGYRWGQQTPVNMAVKAGAAVFEGDLLTKDADGFVTPASSGSTIIGVAMDGCVAPTTNGALSIRVDIGRQGAVYCYPGAATSTSANVLKTCDVGGARVIAEGASADDNILIVGLEGSDFLVCILPTYTGVA